MTRSYQMGERARSVEATRARILESTFALIFECSYEELTLQKVAERAGTTFQTVLRHFDAKDNLIGAVAERFAPEESASRHVAAGDVASVARVLCDRYEATADATLQWEALEDRVEAIGTALRRTRDEHRAWLEEAFADALSALTRTERRRRVAQLYAATDINTWRLWRRRLGMSARDTRLAMESALRALLAPG